jgi:hypothetical protein
MPAEIAGVDIRHHNAFDVSVVAELVGPRHPFALQRDRIAGLDHPLVKPHPQPIRFEPLRQLSDRLLVRAAWLRKTSYSNCCSAIGLVPARSN